jgi:hypothetical protein
VDGPTLESKYKEVKTALCEYCFAVYSLEQVGSNPNFQRLWEQYIQISLVDFLTYVVPELVCEPKKLVGHRIGISKGKFAEAQLIHHVIRIKKICYDLFANEHGNNGISRRDSHDDVLNKIYAFYCEQEKVCRISKNQFLFLYGVINTYSLDPDELKPNNVGYEPKELTELLKILFKDLQLTKRQAYQFILDTFKNKLSAKQICSGWEVTRLMKEKDENTRVALTSKAQRLAVKISPLELLCAFSLWSRKEIILGKKKGAEEKEEAEQTKVKKQKFRSVLVSNDVTLENGLIYHTFFTNIEPQNSHEILIVFPSVHFTRKVLMDQRLKNLNITFLFADKNIVDAINFQVMDVRFMPRVGSNMQFLEYSEWINQGNQSNKRYTYQMVFGTRISLLDQQRMYSEILSRTSDKALFYAVESSSLLEGRRDIFLENPAISNLKVALIPQGINNSTYPRRKILLRCVVSNYHPNMSGRKAFEFRIMRYTLDTALKTQALSKIREKVIAVVKSPEEEIDVTLRKLYGQELLERRAPARTRNASFFHEITPDILVWCSKSYPQNNYDRPRLEAYVCEPVEEGEANNGFRKRGKAIDATKKHTTKIVDDDVLEWLEKEYPYSFVKGRQSKKDKDTAGGSLTSIQEAIIAQYTEYLKDKNIALKTFWYLYPNLSDMYSESAYTMLSEMMDTMIGQERLGNLTAETCEYMLVSQYPEESHNSIWKRFEILATLVDRAVSDGYCEDNDLRNALRQSRRVDKMFAQVRRALTKKHFTKAEMQQAYQYCVNKLAAGEHEYLGVLIRLMTGLENSVVCALRWCDLLYQEEYDVCSFVITRQIASDGSITGFHASEDYICFPIPKQLKEIIMQYKSSRRRVASQATILDSALKPDCKYKAITPTVLKKLSRDMITGIGINERKVILPDADVGYRETDLNKYQGDIIRENFRYWAVQSGRLNADELSYLLRTKANTTLGCFYCDFLNEASQLIMHMKLSRWESSVRSELLCTPKTYRISAGRKYAETISADEAYRQDILLGVTCAEDADVLVELESPYGLSSVIMIADRGEG